MARVIYDIDLPAACQGCQVPAPEYCEGCRDGSEYADTWPPPAETEEEEEAPIARAGPPYPEVPLDEARADAWSRYLSDLQWVRQADASEHIGQRACDAAWAQVARDEARCASLGVRARSPGDPCPRCGEQLLAFSPAGHGRLACDGCATYWQYPEDAGWIEAAP